MSQHILLYENKDFDQCLIQLWYNVKNNISNKNCGMSNFSEFHQDYEYASPILFHLVHGANKYAISHVKTIFMKFSFLPIHFYSIKLKGFLVIIINFLHIKKILAWYAKLN